SAKFLGDWTNEAYLRFPARRIPIYVGATSPRMLALIGSAADGGLPLLFPPESFADALAYIRRGVVSGARNLSELDVAACIWCSVASDHRGAERALREKVAYYGHALSARILDQLGVVRSEFEPIRRAMIVDRDPDRAMALVTPKMLRIG